MTGTVNIGATVTPPTYPARPVNGGPLDKALPKSGDWCWEPKFNGWRTLVHVPTGTMFNRHGQRLSIDLDFQPALKQLRELNWTSAPEWVDCEALERRHNIGRGALIVLDYVPLSARDNYNYRRFNLEFSLPAWTKLNEPIPNDTLWLTPSYPRKNQDQFEPRQLWDILKQCNAALGCEFYEGLVAKKLTSPYPVQLRSPSQEFPFWMKHRWAF